MSNYPKWLYSVEVPEGRVFNYPPVSGNIKWVESPTDIKPTTPLIEDCKAPAENPVSAPVSAVVNKKKSK